MGLLTQATAVPHSGAATDLVFGLKQGTFNEFPTSNYSWTHWLRPQDSTDIRQPTSLRPTRLTVLPLLKSTGTGTSRSSPAAIVADLEAAVDVAASAALAALLLQHRTQRPRRPITARAPGEVARSKMSPLDRRYLTSSGATVRRNAERPVSETSLRRRPHVDRICVSDHFRQVAADRLDASCSELSDHVTIAGKSFSTDPA